jgi:hypothetical protein
MIYEGPRLRAFHIAGLDLIKAKPGSPDQVNHLAVEMRPPPTRFQYGVKRRCQRAIRGSGDSPCSDEMQPPAQYENPPHLDERRDRIQNRAQRPGHHDRSASAKGRCAPDARSNDTGKNASVARLRATRSNLSADRKQRRERLPGRRAPDSVQARPRFLKPNYMSFRSPVGEMRQAVDSASPDREGEGGLAFRKNPYRPDDCWCPVSGIASPPI